MATTKQKELPAIAKIKEINIHTYEGTIPTGTDLVVFEKGEPNTAVVLQGFDEASMFRNSFKNPTYGFMKN